MRHFPFALLSCFCVFFPLTLAAQNDEAENYRQVIKYGTDAELTKLIQTLKQEKNTNFDEDLITMANSTKSVPVRQAVIVYFTQQEADSGADVGKIAALTLDLLRKREGEDAALVSAALDYTTQKGEADAVPVLRGIIESGEARFLPQALRAYGKVLKNADTGEKEKGAEFLQTVYGEKSDNIEARRLALEAMGEGMLGSAAPFLRQLITNADENSILRVEALNSAGKLGDALGGDDLRGAVIGALGATEPLVRTAAVGALGKFAGDEADAALLDALRDSFFRTRLAAIKALAERKNAGLAGARTLENLAGFLEFRARNDEAANVREEAVKTLGIYQTAEADKALEAVYNDKRAPEKIRLLAAETLIKNDGSRWTRKFMADMDEAKKAKQKSLHAGLVKALSAAKGSGVDDLAAALLAGDALDQSYALDIIGSNKLTRFRSQVEAIAGDTKNGLNKKAKSTLEKIK
ncbi:MAG: HEAT repeat domain-containing protein [Spirochaetaceae bacterium]|nr:HEAT repeat domain-containing protein [Spirochaetaceae bacterium]